MQDTRAERERKGHRTFPFGKRLLPAIRRLLPVSFLVLIVAGGAATAGATGSSADVTVQVDRAVVGVSHMDVGVTHTQHSVDSWGNAAAVARGRALLAAAVGYQNQYIYGWGATNPEPSPGHFDWSSLDDRIRLMRSIGGKLVITLCCAPDWMTRLHRDTSTYSLLPPTPAHDADFARLAAAIARRYPDVHYFQVWSELRGYWNPAMKNFDYVAYTRLYNAVYDALKAVSRAIHVGGPYIIIHGSGTRRGLPSQATPIVPAEMQIIEYWLHHAHGADFIDVKRSAKADRDPLRYGPAQMLRFTDLFSSIAAQLRARTHLPLWWSESFFDGGPWQYQAVGLASILYHELIAGSAVSLLWQPQGEATDMYGGDFQNLFSDTRVAGGGRPFPFYWWFKTFHQFFGPGTRLYRARSSSPDLEVLASIDQVLLINRRPGPIEVRLNGRKYHMNRYGIRVVNW